MNKLLTTALISIGFAAAPVMAQPAHPQAPAEAQAHHGARHQHREPRAFSMPGERVEARLAYLKTALKITDAQLPQWNAYADTLRRQAAARDKQIETRRAAMKQGTQRARPTAVERLERRQQHHTAAAAVLSERLAAQKPLYASLSDEQKRVADTLLAGGGREGRFRQRGGRHGRA